MTRYLPHGTRLASHGGDPGVLLPVRRAAEPPPYARAGSRRLGPGGRGAAGAAARPPRAGWPSRGSPTWTSFVNDLDECPGRRPRPPPARLSNGPQHGGPASPTALAPPAGPSRASASRRPLVLKRPTRATATCPGALHRPTPTRSDAEIRHGAGFGPRRPSPEQALLDQPGVASRSCWPDRPATTCGCAPATSPRPVPARLAGWPMHTPSPATKRPALGSPRPRLHAWRPAHQRTPSNCAGSVPGWALLRPPNHRGAVFLRSGHGSAAASTVREAAGTPTPPG